VQPRQKLPPGLLRLSQLQEHVLTREQCLGHGFSRHAVTRMVADGLWRSITRGVYVTLPVPAPPWPTLAWAGVLIGGDRARVRGADAAFLHGLSPAAPERIPILVPAGHGVPTVTGPWAFSRERVGVRAARSPGSPPRLPVEDVVLDLVHQSDDPAEVVGWVTAAVQNRLTTPGRLRAATRGGLRGRTRPQPLAGQRQNRLSTLRRVWSTAGSRAAVRVRAR
jgi:hypothetical protein